MALFVISNGLCCVAVDSVEMTVISGRIDLL